MGYKSFRNFSEPIKTEISRYSERIISGEIAQYLRLNKASNNIKLK
jgi:DNA-directed RNA polymerase specialized sigma subunit